MKKPYLLLGVLGSAGTLLLAACGHQLVADPMAPVRAWIGGGGALASLPNGTVTMIVRPTIAQQAYRAQSLIAPYQATDVSRLRIELWKIASPAPLVPEAAVDLTQDQLNSPTTFSNLAANTSYEIRCFAYGLDDSNQEVLISDSAQSTIRVDVGSDNLIDVSIVVKLGDSDFMGTGSATISIIPGGYTARGRRRLPLARQFLLQAPPFRPAS